MHNLFKTYIEPILGPESCSQICESTTRIRAEAQEDTERRINCRVSRLCHGTNSLGFES